MIMPEFKRRIWYHVELVGCFTKITSTTNFRKNIACKYMKCSTGKVNEILQTFITEARAKGDYI